MFGIDRDQTTNTYYNNEEVSVIEWTFLKDEVAKNVTAGEYDIWNKFKRWLHQQEVITVMDFQEYIKWN